MILKDLTLEQSFPIAFHKDLLIKQSEHFTNNSIACGTLEGGYENIPTQLPINKINAPLLINSKPPNLLIGIYIKNHWRVILTSMLIGGVVWYFIDRNIKKARLRKKIKI